MKAAAAAKPKPKGKPEPKAKSQPKPDPKPALAVVPEPERAPADSLGEPSRRWKSENSKLPMVSRISDQEAMEQAIAALQRAADAKQQKEAWERIEDAAKTELAALALANGLNGFRWGKLGVSVNYQASSRLNIKKLVENGVDPEIIEQSYEKGEEHLVVAVIPFL